MVLIIAIVWGHVVANDSGPSRSSFDVFVIVVAVFSALVHSIIYTYFIAASKYIMSAIDFHNYQNPDVLVQAKSNKRIAFRYAFISILMIMAATFLYFASSPVRGDYAISVLWPAITSYIMLFVLIYTIKQEWKYIVANCVLTDMVTSTLNTMRNITEAKNTKQDANVPDNPV